MDGDHFEALSPSLSTDTSREVANGGRATRRVVVKLLSAYTLAAAARVQAPSALAIRGWCRRDPIVKIGDFTVQIMLFSEPEMHGSATGPTQLVITVPSGTFTRFVADDPGFGHHGYDVRFAESGELTADSRTINVQLDAYAPATDRGAGPLPLVLEVAPRGVGGLVIERAEGRANEWVHLRASLARDDAQSGGSPAEPPDPKPEKKRSKDRRKKHSR